MGRGIFRFDFTRRKVEIPCSHIRTVSSLYIGIIRCVECMQKLFHTSPGSSDGRKLKMFEDNAKSEECFKCNTEIFKDRNGYLCDLDI